MRERLVPFLTIKSYKLVTPSSLVQSMVCVDCTRAVVCVAIQAVYESHSGPAARDEKRQEGNVI